MPPSPANQVLSRVIADHLVGHTLPQALCRVCAEGLPATGVGVALVTRDGHKGVVAATGGIATQVEDLQFAVGEGPSLDAARDGRPMLQADLTHSGLTRWPVFVSEALALDVLAVFAFPLQIGGIQLGVLSLYRESAGMLNDDELADAVTFTEVATAILLHLQTDAELAEGLHPQLAVPLLNRIEVNVATGMVSAQAGVRLGEALVLLRANAYASERSVLEVAKDVVARTLRFDPGDES